MDSDGNKPKLSHDLGDLGQKTGHSDGNFYSKGWKSILEQSFIIAPLKRVGADINKENKTTKEMPFSSNQC